ncbi:MAG: nucleotidyl transferase AbiEii/AbiGii toxin family protein [Elusimicrobia bacterium]|nr:nucleotidyl transferase AbiEii/AbiGii toxin family protein [Elusimicrobiota bacterium]
MDKAKPVILTDIQRKLLGALFADSWFRRHFYLTGGTALAAFHLFHRYSDDLDFFSHGVDFAPVRSLMASAAKQLGLDAESLRTSPGFLRFQIGSELKVDIVGDVEFRVGAPELAGQFMVDNIKNIAVNKVCAILGRLDAKDYIDLYMILKPGTLDIFELLALGRKKDAGLDPFVWASLIADVKQLAIMPRMVMTVPRSDLESFYLRLRDELLDKLNPGKK